MTTVLLLVFGTAGVTYRPEAQISIGSMHIIYPAFGSTISDNQPVVRGTAIPGSPVYIIVVSGPPSTAFDGPVTVCPGLIADGAGNWSCSLAANGVTLPLGENAIIASNVNIIAPPPFTGRNNLEGIFSLEVDISIFTVTDATPIWYIPGGIPNGVATNLLPLESMTQFVYNGTTYNPPATWQLFAGQGLKVKIKNWITPSVQICFAYPKALTGWHGQIYYLQGGTWVGQATNQITISGYGTLPFLCTLTTKTGVYIVID